MSLPIFLYNGWEHLYSCVITPFFNNKEGFQHYNLYLLKRPKGKPNWVKFDCKLRKSTLSSLQMFARAGGYTIHNELFNITPEGAIEWKLGKSIA